MNNPKFNLNFALWMGVLGGIYVFLYCISPLASYGVMYATYIAFPIYFNGGAKKDEFFNYAFSSILGVLWGIVFLQGIEILSSLGISSELSQALAVCILTTICASLHLIILDRTFFNKLPAIFGAIAATFSTGGEKAIPLMITLFLGVALAYISAYALNILDSEGNWKFKKESTESE
ncbi:DUF1097 domain-containing protein [Enterococcus sp. DIV0756]|uniref:DUF1097 domain-containing protein n=1 Tax=Enterococcus sp. DIV0756 TaxID=2774636 RepID=UPI003F684F2D